MYVTAPGEFPVPVSLRSRKTKHDENFKVHDLKQDQHLFREGDDAKHIYEIVSGVLRLTRVLENGRRQVIAFGFPGDFVGFPCCGLHHTECDAITPARVVYHRREALEDGAVNPELHAVLLQAALREIRAMQDHFMMLGCKSAREKTASFLSVLAQRTGTKLGAYTEIKLPMSRSDIADFLGLTTETVCRTISQLRSAKVIALEDPHVIVVLKPEALLALAESD